MNFDELMHYDLTTRLDRIIPLFWFCTFDIDRIHYIT